MVYIMNTFNVKRLVSNSPENYVSSKRISEYTRLTLFSNSPNSKMHSSARRYRHLTPIWNIKDSDIKPIKSRSRLDDFSRDSLHHIFPNKSPASGRSSKIDPPPITPEKKFFNKKSDQIVSHREAIIRLNKQGFLILRKH